MRNKMRTSDLRDQTVNGSLQVHCWLGVVQAVVQETLHGHVSHSASVCLPLFLSLPLSLSLSLVYVTLSYSWTPHWGERRRERLHWLLAAHSQYSCVNAVTPKPVGEMVPQTCLCDESLSPSVCLHACVRVCICMCAWQTTQLRMRYGHLDGSDSAGCRWIVYYWHVEEYSKQ